MDFMGKPHEAASPRQILVKISQGIILEFTRFESAEPIKIRLMKWSGDDAIGYKAELTSFHLEDGISKFCSSNSEWALENPGIIVAACLQEVFKITFTDASITSMLKPTTSTLSINNVKREELFNVYGPLRLLLHDIDDWYIKMKNRVLFADVGIAYNVSIMPYTKNMLGFIPTSVISFHYVSESETIILFSLLSNKSKQFSEQELWKLWPRGAKVGDYARPLKSQLEAETLLQGIKAIEVD